MEYKGIAYLRDKLNYKKLYVDMRYRYYNGEFYARDFRISVPPQLRNAQVKIGWCSKAIDSLADRLVFREFRNDPFDINYIYQMNNPDVLFDSAIHGALTTSCDFIYISPDDDGFPRLQVIDGGHATGQIDPITGLLFEGYAVLEADEYDNPVVEAYLIKGETQIYRKGERNVDVFKHNVDYPLLVPIIYKPDEKRPFGHSLISRACMDYTDSAVRTVLRGEISAEFYSYPQKYILGLSEDAEYDKWQSTMSSMLTFSKDSEGDVPTVGQFTQQSMAPHTEQLKMFASLFAGEVGLTLDDLGFNTGNPMSAEAIKASHDSLRLAARKAQRTFGSGLLNAGYLAACLRDNMPYKRNALYNTQPIWEPIFEADASMLSVIGDGAIKLNQAVDGFVTKENLYDLTGIKSTE